MSQHSVGRLMCEKKPFISKREAKLYLKLRRRNRGFRSKHAYECAIPGCGMWHLTSQTAGEKWFKRDEARRRKAA